MKLGQQQKRAAMAAADNEIGPTNFKRIGNRWAIVGYRKTTPDEPSHLWGGYLLQVVSRDPWPTARAHWRVEKRGEFFVYFTRHTARTRRELVALLEQQL